MSLQNLFFGGDSYDHVDCFADCPSRLCLLIGRTNALVAAPVINGGIIATTTMVKAATDQGLPLTAALAAFLYATQKFVGTLPASSFGLKAAGRYVEDFRRMKQEDPSFSLDSSPRPETGKKASFAERNTHRFTIYISLAIAAFAAYLGTLGGKLTHNWVGMFLWCMILGMVARNLGLVPANIIKKNANASGFFIFGALTAIVPSLAKVDFSMLGQLGFLVLCVFTVTVAGIILAFKILPLWKIVGDKDLCIGIAMCQMIGYPGTQLISEEISKAVGRTPEEIEYLEKRIGTAYVISGFTSVTVLSIVVATIMAKIL